MLSCLSPHNPSLGQLRGCLHGVWGPPLQDLRREGLQLPGKLQVPPDQGLLNVPPVSGVADPVLLHQVELPELLVMRDGESCVTGGAQSADI